MTPVRHLFLYDMDEFNHEETLLILGLERGGPGSGNFDHGGRPGEVGGSSSSKAENLKIPSNFKTASSIHGNENGWIMGEKKAVITSGENHTVVAESILKENGIEIKETREASTKLLEMGAIRVQGYVAPDWLGETIPAKDVGLEVYDLKNGGYEDLKDMIGSLTLIDLPEELYIFDYMSKAQISISTNEFLESEKVGIVDNQIVIRGISMDEFEKRIYEAGMKLTARSSFRISKDIDTGKFRWFAWPACTAFINRDNEIDSTKLFDNMIRHIKEGEKWPTLDFFHLGKHNDAFTIGDTDFVARDGVSYLMSGTFRDTPLAQKALIALGTDSESYWGTSIQYEPIGKPSKIRIGNEYGEENDVVVYEDGIQIEVSVLPEMVASSRFTAIPILPETKEAPMNKLVRQALEKLVQDPVFREELTGIVDDVNKLADDPNMVSRDVKPEEPKKEDVKPEEVQRADAPTDAPPESQQPELVGPTVSVDEKVLKQIVDGLLASPSFTKVLADAVKAAMEEKTAAVEEASKAVEEKVQEKEVSEPGVIILEEIKKSVEDVATRMTSLETLVKKSEEKKLSDQKRELAEKPKTQIKLADVQPETTERARNSNDNERVMESDFAIVAESVLAKMDRVQH